jgi:hypothetical protein
MSVTRDDVVKWLLESDDIQDLDSIDDIIRTHRASLGVRMGMVFKPGDRVIFDAKTRGIITGTFMKLNQKNAKVKADSGAVWTVAPMHLRKA